MHAGILDKPAMGIHPPADNASQVQMRYIGFHGDRIILRLEGRVIDSRTCLPEEIETGLIARQGDHIVVRDRLNPFRRLNVHFFLPDRHEAGVREGRNAALLDAVLDIRFYPVFYPRPNTLSTNDHGHFRTLSPGFQGRVHRGIAGAHNDHLLHGVEVGLFYSSGATFGSSFPGYSTERAGHRASWPGRYARRHRFPRN